MGIQRSHCPSESTGRIEIVGIEPADQGAAGAAESLSKRIGWAGIAAAHHANTRISGGQVVQQLKTAID